MVVLLLAWGGKGIIIRSKEGEIGFRIIKRLLNRFGEIHEPSQPMKGGWVITPMGGWFGGMMESPIQYFPYGVLRAVDRFLNEGVMMVKTHAQGGD